MLALSPLPSMCQDYIDFTDMGSYDHGLQINRVEDKAQEDESHEHAVSLRVTHTKLKLTGISTENSSRPMKYLQRVVQSILRQMNVQSHTFGPGEAITIDLQAEIKYDDYVVLNKFMNAENDDEDKYLHKVDDIMSNLIHVVEHSSYRFEYLEFILNLPIFTSLKFSLVMITMSVVCFLIIMLSLRTVYAVDNISMLFYGFLIIFILSCIWTFSYMYEDAKATNYAKLVQAQRPPKDCEYENLNLKDSISYFFRVQLFGYKDQCEQYYSTTMTDPFWSVNPLEAISNSFSVLVFAPFGYIGDKLGRFFGGLISGIPFWLQPLLVLLMFGFSFLSIFGYRLVSPFLTIEPAPRRYIEQVQRENNSSAITDREKNELIERPEKKIMKSIRDAATDMDDFENYLRGTDDETRSIQSNSSWIPLWIVEWILYLWESFFQIMDILLRQLPQGEFPPPDNFNFNDDLPVPQNPQNQEDDLQPRQIEIEDVIIPRRRMHVRLEGGEHNKENEVDGEMPSTSSAHQKSRESSKVKVEKDEQKNGSEESETSESDNEILRVRTED